MECPKSVLSLNTLNPDPRDKKIGARLKYFRRQRITESVGKQELSDVSKIPKYAISNRAKCNDQVAELSIVTGQCVAAVCRVEN